MRNLFAFLLKRYPLFLFLFLEVIAIYLVAQHNFAQQTFFINSNNQISSLLLKKTNDISQYFSLHESNKQLLKENEYLRSISKNSYIINDKKYFHQNDSIYQQQYEFQGAKVIKNTISKRDNYLMLSKGSKHGIKKEMAVVSSEGIVGIVVETSKNFSSVMSVLHSKSKISAKLKANEHRGTVLWNGKDYRKGTFLGIPAHIKIEKGDTIISSGNSLYFPQGIPIGIIEDYEIEKKDRFYNITFKFCGDFNNLSYVYVINNLLREEQILLEKSIIPEDE